MSNNDLDNILNFNNNVVEAAQPKQPKHKITDKPAVEKLVEALQPKETKAKEKTYHTFPINMNAALDRDLQVHMAMTGLTLRKITSKCAAEFLATDDKPALINAYGADTTETKRRGINIDLDVFDGLKSYAESTDQTMRFVVEALLSAYMKQNKMQ